MHKETGRAEAEQAMQLAQKLMARYRLSLADLDNVPIGWNIHGKAAGPIRNESMVNDFPISHALAFWRGHSRGTAHMISVLQRKKIPYVIYDTTIKISDDSNELESQWTL